MTRLLSPVGRVTVGQGSNREVWETGSGVLQSISVTLGEDKRASQGSVTLNDPEGKIAQKFFATSFSQGGLTVPALLLQDPQPVTTTYAGTGSGQTVSGNLSARMRATLDMISFTEGTYGKGNGGYNIKFGGGTFNNNKGHPGGPVHGRYQFQAATWRGLGGGPMTPVKQDIGAVKLIAEKGGTAAAEKGDLTTFFSKLRGIWTSLPGAGEPNSNTSKARTFYAERYKLYAGQGGGTIGTPADTSGSTDTTTQTEQPLADFKGTSVTIELGYSFDQLTGFSFVHTGSQFSGRSPDVFTLECQSIRWLMTRRKKNTSYSKISLKQLATKVAKGYGLTLKMDGEGPKYAYLDQTGLSDYGLLLRECNAIGYSIREEGKTLILQPWKANFTGFVITLDIVDELSFTDKASVEANNNAASVTTTTPSTKSGDRKTRTDRLSGKSVKEAKENSKATGKQGTKATTGSPTKSVTGTAVLPGSETGLPNQKTGAIQLSTGTAQAQDILDESRRVKGYESTAKFKTTPEALTLAPGSIIGIDKEIVPSVFSREWRVSTITHELSPSGMSTSLSFYSPQKQKPPQQTATDGSVSVGNLAPGAWTHPLPGGKITRELAHGYQAIDISTKGGTGPGARVLAASDGQITRVVGGYGGGYGNHIRIAHAGGVETLYAHLYSTSAQAGQAVRAGQGLGIEGNTGDSNGTHLHFEVRVNGNRVTPSQFMAGKGVKL